MEGGEKEKEKKDGRQKKKKKSKSLEIEEWGKIAVRVPITSSLPRRMKGPSKDEKRRRKRGVFSLCAGKMREEAYRPTGQRLSSTSASEEGRKGGE